MDQGRTSRLNDIRAAIRVRLSGVCADWPEGEFDLLVERLAAVTLKYERLGSASAYDRRDTIRLIEEMKEAIDRGRPSPPDAPASAGDPE